jgi:hypothetical protein
MFWAYLNNFIVRHVGAPLHADVPKVSRMAHAFLQKGHLELMMQRGQRVLQL